MRFGELSLRLAVAGVVAGVASAVATLLFSVAIDALAALFQSCTLLVWLLPVAGLACYGLYHLLRVEFPTSTRSVLAGVDAGERAPLALAPAIFLATCLGIAFGGSLGKVAAALQMAGALAPAVGGLFGLRDEHALRLYVLCGMAASLDVLFGIPLAAAVFVFELFRPRRESLWSLLVVLACTLLSELLAYGVSAERLVYAVTIPAFSLGLLGRAALVVALGSAAGALFCALLEQGRAFTQSHLHPAFWLVVGGLAYAAILTASGRFDVAGTGIDQIMLALSGGVDGPFFLVKLLLTALLLVCGFKGGEITPTLCIGATLGCLVGVWLGGDAGFLAALGMVVLFAACTDCPLAAVLLGVEAFGFGGILWYIAGAAVAYLLTSRLSLYRNKGRARDWPLLPRALAKEGEGED